MTDARPPTTDMVATEGFDIGRRAYQPARRLPDGRMIVDAWVRLDGVVMVKVWANCDHPSLGLLPADCPPRVRKQFLRPAQLRRLMETSVDLGELSRLTDDILRWQMRKAGLAEATNRGQAGRADEAMRRDAMTARFEERVIIEERELTQLLDRLDAFIGGDAFLALDPEEQTLLKQQAEVMRLYAEILNKRIARF
jgi:hypothetical protein